MKKILLTGLTGLLAGLTMSAAQLSPDQALKRLPDAGNTRSERSSDLRHVYSFNLSDGQPGVYVFQRQAGEGFLLLSADDIAAPVLGYSETGRFDENAMSPSMKWWIGEYSRQIEYGRETGAESYERVTTRSGKASIDPMVKTKWNQSAPYNDMAPEADGKHCVTGCVATATAQVMKFWNYPEIGKGIGECTVNFKDGSQQTERMSFSEQKFDWDNMLDVYDGNSTQVQNDAVAYLMKACGYAVKMSYSTSESAAAVLYVAQGLIDNFSYNENLQYCQRNYYAATAWEDLVYDELAAGRPVIYGGQSTQGGHCFVCDGYSDDGYFHFNWGWGGMSDGYFILNALNPGSLGIGANGGGYNFGQEIVVGVQPTTGKQYPPNFIQQGNMQAQLQGVSLTLTTGESGGWFNIDTKTITIDLGTKIEPIAPTTGETVYTDYKAYANQTLAPRYGWNTLNLSMPRNLENGTYRLTLVYRLSGTQEWTPVRCEQEYFNYVEFTKDGNKYTIRENVEAIPVIEDATLLTPLYYGEAVKLSMTVSNPSGKELTNSFYPALYTGNRPVMIADGVVLNLAPGEKVTKEFECVFGLLNGNSAPQGDTEYTLYFYDPTAPETSASYLQTYQGFSKNVTMKLNTGAVNISVDDFSIQGCGTIHKYNNDFYEVTDQSDIVISLSITNYGEYFAKPIGVAVFPYRSGEVSNLDYVELTPVPLLTEGESATLTATLNFTAGELDNYYFCIPYIGNNGLDARMYFTIVENASVGEVGASELVVAYDKAASTLLLSEDVAGLQIIGMNGIVSDRSAEAASGTVNIKDLPAGIYVVKAIDAEGNSKTLKIAK